MTLRYVRGGKPDAPEAPAGAAAVAEGIDRGTYELWRAQSEPLPAEAVHARLWRIYGMRLKLIWNAARGGPVE